MTTTKQKAREVTGAICANGLEGCSAKATRKAGMRVFFDFEFDRWEPGVAFVERGAIYCRKHAQKEARRINGESEGTAA